MRRDYCSYCAEVRNLYPASYIGDTVYYNCEHCHRFVISEEEPSFSDKHDSPEQPEQP